MFSSFKSYENSTGSAASFYGQIFRFKLACFIIIFVFTWSYIYVCHCDRHEISNFELTFRHIVYTIVQCACVCVSVCLCWRTSWCNCVSHRRSSSAPPSWIEQLAVNKRAVRKAGASRPVSQRKKHTWNLYKQTHMRLCIDRLEMPDWASAILALGNSN